MENSQDVRKRCKSVTISISLNGIYRRRLRKLRKRIVFSDQALITRQIYLGDGSEKPKKGMYRRESFMYYKGDIIIDGVKYKKITITDFFDLMPNLNDNPNGRRHIHSHSEIKRRMKSPRKFFIWFDKNKRLRRVCWNNNSRPHFKSTNKNKNGNNYEASIQENDTEENIIPLDSINDPLYRQISLIRDFK